MATKPPAPPAKKAADPRGSAPPAPPEAETKPPTAEDDPKPRRRKEELVSVTIPRAFRLAHDDGTHTQYEPGVQDIPKSHADHWYTKAHGVELNDD